MARRSKHADTFEGPLEGSTSGLNWLWLVVMWAAMVAVTSALPAQSIRPPTPTFTGGETLPRRGPGAIVRWRDGRLSIDPRVYRPGRREVEGSTLDVWSERSTVHLRLITPETRIEADAGGHWRIETADGTVAVQNPDDVTVRCGEAEVNAESWITLRDEPLAKDLLQQIDRMTPAETLGEHVTRIGRMTGVPEAFDPRELRAAAVALADRRAGVRRAAMRTLAAAPDAAAGYLQELAASIPDRHAAATLRDLVRR